MKILISMSADTYSKGDRLVYKAAKNRWHTGTVTSVRSGLVGILFDDGVKGAPSKPSPRTWKKITSKRVIKKELTDVEAEALAAPKQAKVAPAKVPKSPVKVKPVSVKKTPQDAASKVVKTTPVTSAKDTPKSFIGSVVDGGRFGPIIILAYKFGRKYTEWKWAMVSDTSKTGWLKSPIHVGDDYMFGRYKFIRMATKEEFDNGKAGVRAMQDKKYDRLDANRQGIDKQDLKPGDVVSVKYSNGTKKEAVLEVDYRSGQIAIVRQQPGAASTYTKRRMIPVSICTKVADGGGKFDPNNTLYSEHHIYVPEFYKSGNTVAARRPARRPERWSS